VQHITSTKDYALLAAEWHLLQEMFMFCFLCCCCYWCNIAGEGWPDRITSSWTKQQQQQQQQRYEAGAARESS
jgi:hypothetical protein